MMYRSLALLLVLAASPLMADADNKGESMNPEQTVCGIKEPFLFWLWSRTAGAPNADRVSALCGVQDLAFETGDGRTLRGYKLKAGGCVDRDSAARAFLLVLQGNAILADQIVAAFQPFSAAGFDVYIYDYRGYGRSEGKRRLKAMIGDYTEILAALDSAGYSRGFVYAMSFGGIVLLGAYENLPALNGIIIDSTPSRLSDYGCPVRYDPIEHLPGNCSHFMFIVGENDAVVTPAMSRDLVKRAQHCNATVVRDETFGHPFMDYNRAVHRKRMAVIRDYLIQW